MSLELALVLILAALAAGFVLLSRTLSGKIRELEELRRADTSPQILSQSIQAMHDRLSNTSQSLERYGLELRSMQEVGKNVNDLRQAFFSPKLRGNFGERVLADMLTNAFPQEQYGLQHRFRDGQIVDAIIRTKDGIICIDSKFPIENYRKMVAATTDADRDFETREFKKAVKKHITDIASKYILPAEGTMTVAVMFVPSEAVFYEIISGSEELLAAAEENHVLITSPNTMAYFLHVLRMGYERIRIEENVQRVWENIAGLQQDFAKFGENLRKLWSHVNNAKNVADALGNEFTKLNGRVEDLTEK